MVDALTQADDPNIVFEKITSWETYLNAKRSEKLLMNLQLKSNRNRAILAPQ